MSVNPYPKIDMNDPREVEYLQARDLLGLMEYRKHKTDNERRAADYIKSLQRRVISPGITHTHKDKE